MQEMHPGCRIRCRPAGQIDLKRARRTLQQGDLHGMLGPRMQPNYFTRRADIDLSGCFSSRRAYGGGSRYISRFDNVHGLLTNPILVGRTGCYALHSQALKMIDIQCLRMGLGVGGGGASGEAQN
jgi:hypothetical protein